MLIVHHTSLREDFTLFVIDIHQNMLISLFKTSFDHFQFRPTSGMTSIHYLTVCHSQLLDVQDDNADDEDDEDDEDKTHCEVMDGSHSRSRTKLKVVK